VTVPFYPEHYDSETRIVHGNGRYCEQEFVEQAIHKFQRYGQTDWLLWAIEHSLPSILELEQGRELFARAVKGDLRKRGSSPSRNLGADLKRDRILRRVYHHQATGLPIYVNPESNADAVSACSLVAGELNCSARHAYRVWAEAGGDEPTAAHYKVLRAIIQAEARDSQ
jgi:hypothetical protein